MKPLKSFVSLGICLVLAACAVPKPPVVIPPVTPPVTAVPAPPFAVSKWEMLPGWLTLDLSQSWQALLLSCDALKSKAEWQRICDQAGELGPDTGNDKLRKFFETWFVPYQVYNPDGSDHGTITGYYEPKVYGSRTRSERFRYPLYAVPDDMFTIDLTEVYPQLSGMRLRGRIDGKRIVPYYSRADIDAGMGALKGRELFWIDNAVDLFFLQIQGSGRIELPDGSLVKVGYADQNGHPYVSIGRKLVESGELKLENASMQGIKKWAEKNPDKLEALLAQNPSFVFFRELPDGLSAPLGALGVPLTGGYSIAVDTSTIPLGSPVLLSTTEPGSDKPLNRLMLAQDTGGAIKGAVRADFFWGFGEEAGAMAGRMKQQGRMWVLFPKGAEPDLQETAGKAGTSPSS